MECDQWNKPLDKTCKAFNQFLDLSLDNYKDANEQEKKDLNMLLTGLDYALHKNFIEVGIIPEKIMPALQKLGEKIDNLATKGEVEKLVLEPSSFFEQDHAKKEMFKISGITTKADLSDLVTRKNLGVEKQNVDLKKLVKKSDLSIGDNDTFNLKTLVKKSDLKIPQNEEFDLRDLVKKADLGLDGTTPVDLNLLATKEEVEKLALNPSSFFGASILKTREFETSGLATKVDLNNLNQQVTKFARQDQAFDQAITQEIKTISQGMNIIPEEAKVELVKGNEVAGKYEAEIKLEGKSDKIGTFSQVGYYFYDNRIYIYDHLKPQVSIDLPQQFHFLKVVKTEEDGYKLAFCNEHGNEYYNIPDDYRLISPVDVKSIKNINLEKYYAKNGSNPSFVAKTSSSSYTNSERHGVDIYEINNGKEQIGSLIDEFGYYDSQSKFHYFNNHTNAGDHSYNSPLFTINEGNNKCHLHKMQEGGKDIDLTSDAAACSLVEYVANYVNNEYFYH